MPVDFNKILSHPLVDEIISKLVNGIQPKDLAEYLKIKYPGKDETHLRLSASLLKEFLDSNLDLYQTINNDIKAVKNGTIDTKKISAALKNNKTYQERMLDAINDEIDIKGMFKTVYVLLNARLEQYFDRMQENPNSLKPDYGLLKYFEQMISFAQAYDKTILKSPDQIVQHNVTIQVMDQYVTLFQDSIRQTLSEMDPEAANLFMEKFNENISKLQLPDNMQPIKPQTQEQRHRGVELLQSKLEEIEGN